MRQITFILLSLLALSVSAQSTYTAHLRKQMAGKGTVIITQSDEIERLVNNKAAQTQQKSKVGTASDHPSGNNKKTHEAEAAHHSAADANRTHHDSEEDDKQASHTTSGKHYTERARHKAQGFRICIYTGGNSRKDKAKAYEMAEKCRKQFGELATYPSFVAPRWVTHVGDFRTRQDAQKYVTLIRKSRISYEVRIVKSEVNLPN